LLKHIVSRDAREKDSFVVSVLKYWSGIQNGEKLSELISSQLTKLNSTKRKRPANNKSQVSNNTEQLLIYLDQLRQTSINCKCKTLISRL